MSEKRLTARHLLSSGFRSFVRISYSSGVFVLLLILLSSKAYPSVYYISSTNGDDSRSAEQAKNSATPWKTLEKLNTFIPQLTGGDSVLFKSGDIFFGSLLISKSGALFAPLYFGAYGQGNKPQISGFRSVTNWKLTGNGIYESSVHSVGNNVVVNNIQGGMGRFPNKGYFSLESHNGNSSITDNQLTSEIDWAGAELVIRKNRWTIDKSLITRHTSNTLFYAAGNKAIPINGYGYFIQNDIRTLDEVGEWYINNEREKIYLYFGNTKPGSAEVLVSTVTNLVEIKGHSNIIINNLAFVGAGNNAFNIKDAHNVVISNSNIDNTGADALLVSYSKFFSVKNCVIRNSGSGGVNLDGGCTNATVVDNYISKVGLVPGMGRSGTGTYEGITAFGDFTTIEKNRIDSVGYNGVYFGGNSSTVKNNFISSFCLTKDDGGGIYVGDWSKTYNKSVHGNVIIDGIGNGQGTTYPGSLQAEGIYIDDNSESVEISDNTISNCSNNGIKIHNAQNIKIVNNTAFNNGVQLRLEQDCYLSTSTLIRNNNVHNNLFFSKHLKQSNVSLSTNADDINDFGKIDSNFYNRPESEFKAVKSMSHPNGKNTTTKHNMLSWTNASGNDQTSSEIACNSILFEYNGGKESITVKLKNDYIDVYNNLYRNEISILPYRSVILFPRETKIVNPQVQKRLAKL